MAAPIRVLVVDEDHDVLELTEAFLHRETDRLAVETEASARAAVDRVADGAFDCVVSDVRMPEMDGFELFEAVRGTDSGIPFLLFTAADEVTGEEALAAGVSGVVRKGAGTDHYRELADHILEAVE